MQYYPTSFPLHSLDVEFRQVKDYPNYYVTNTGEVWSYSARYPFQTKPTWKKLKYNISYYKNGKVHNCWIDFRDKKRRGNGSIGPLVLTTFVGPKPTGMECCHEDGNPLNNHTSNLRWDSHLANMKDMRRHWTANGKNGKKTPYEMAVIILQIARDYKLGDTKVSRIVGLPKPTIAEILYRKGWKDFRKEEHPRIHLIDRYRERIKIELKI